MESHLAIVGLAIALALSIFMLIVLFSYYICNRNQMLLDKQIARLKKNQKSLMQYEDMFPIYHGSSDDGSGLNDPYKIDANDAAIV